MLLKEQPRGQSGRRSALREGPASWARFLADGTATMLWPEKGRCGQGSKDGRRDGKRQVGRGRSGA